MTPVPDAAEQRRAARLKLFLERMRQAMTEAGLDDLIARD